MLTATTTCKDFKPIRSRPDTILLAKNDLSVMALPAMQTKIKDKGKNPQVKDFCVQREDIE